ncbi:hypothetical protein [Dolichospermum compactum]|uniref:hypothetical protein n=1 Tax=Dolichospermum compactum TaxID=136073 RepID=UPI0012FD4AA8|nr:hypothetical protein [Dolichospermum compactum]
MCLRYVESELSYSILSNSDTFGALRYRTPQNHPLSDSHGALRYRTPQNHPTSDRTPQNRTTSDRSLQNCTNTCLSVS